MAKTLPISEVKMTLAELIAGLESGDEEAIITRNGRPAAVLVTTEAYEALRETLAILAHPEALAQIQRAQAYFAVGHQGLAPDEVFDE